MPFQMIWGLSNVQAFNNNLKERFSIEKEKKRKKENWILQEKLEKFS